ncbi:hypothetical protein BH09ACT7_BH09ACT7_30530 [soil metagenome]
MTQTAAVSMTAALVAAALLAAPGVAHADLVVPQLDAPCSENLGGALTQLPDGKTYLECNNSSGRYQWSEFTSPYPSSDRWFTYGPAVKLHGQGLRNPQILSGKWTAYPQEAGTLCAADQASVVSAGEVGPTQTSTGEPGEPLALEVLPVVFSITLSGNCLWEAAPAA